MGHEVRDGRRTAWRSLRAAGGTGGLLLGTSAGLVAGLQAVLANRYFELDLHRLATRELAWDAGLGAAGGMTAGMAVALLGGALAAALRQLPPPTAANAAGLAVLAIAFQAVVVALLAILRTLPAWPTLREPAGVAAAVLLSLAAVVMVPVARGAAPAAQRAGAALMRGVSRRWVGALPIAALGALGGSVVAWDRNPPPDAKSFVLVTADTLRADHLGVYGYARDTSPALDALAREGVQFEQAAVQWPKTTPSFVSMLTSTYPRTNGVTRNTGMRLPEGLVTLAERFSDAGWATAAVVTNSNLARVFRFDQGFDVYVEAWSRPRPDDPERAAHVTAEALAWLGGRPPDRPFFLWVHYVDPHARYEPPAPFDGMFVGDAFYSAARRAPLHAGRDEDMGGIPARAALGARDEVDYYVAQYDAEIRYMDHEIGRLLRGIDRAGLRERTVVAFTSDHGESLGEHRYYFDHGRLPYDDCVRVPLIFRVPGGRAGLRWTRPVELVDLHPTLLALAGLPIGSEVQGRSLLPALEGRDDPARAAWAFSESGYETPWQVAIRDEAWKLVHVPSLPDRALMTGEEWELYHLAADPGEKVNLVQAEGARVARMRAALEAWERRSGKAPPATPPEIDAATAARLRALGYVD